MGFDPEAKMHGAVTARFPSYSGIEITSILARNLQLGRRDVYL